MWSDEVSETHVIEGWNLCAKKLWEVGSWKENKTFGGMNISLTLVFVVICFALYFILAGKQWIFKVGQDFSTILDKILYMKQSKGFKQNRTGTLITAFT